ncbi:MAG: hydroxymethylglutaryl-CoA lyase [Actinobacteria bacterium]|nr:hydroxymethylglutaryl-CoA lyase [Actinomycetota bacterium]
MPEVRIREVGPRDGLQAEAYIEVGARVALIADLIRSGVHTIEAVSFVSEKAVPAMAGAAAVLESLGPLPGVTIYALVPNVKGAARAAECGIDHFTVTVSASAAYNAKNVRMTIDESVAEVAAIRDLIGPSPYVDAVVSCAFGSPYEGDLAPADVHALGERLVSAGANASTYADTTGMATPRRIADLVAVTGPRIGLHLHETRGTAMVNAYAALELGVRDFDTSIGGLGGSPFAAGAGGNLSTEDFVHLLDDVGLSTGIDLEQLLTAAARLATVLGRPLPGKVANAGPRSRLAAG